MSSMGHERSEVIEMIADERATSLTSLDDRNRGGLASKRSRRVATSTSDGFA
jgi:hypothetical protein